jgi:hypothetical protein
MMLCNASWYTPHIPSWGYGVCIMLCSVMLCYVSDVMDTLLWGDIQSSDTSFIPSIWSILGTNSGALPHKREEKKGPENAVVRTNLPRIGGFLFYARAYIYRVVYPK